MRVLGRHQEALQCFDKALAIDPKAAVWNLKGIALHELGRHQEALQCCDKTLATNPKSATAWAVKELRLHSQAATKRRSHASTRRSRSIRRMLRRGNARAWRLKGVTLGQLGRHQEALPVLRQGARDLSEECYGVGEQRRRA